MRWFDRAKQSTQPPPSAALAVAVPCLLVSLVACSDPQCPPGKRLVGTACLGFAKAADAGDEPEAEQGSERDESGSHRDSGATTMDGAAQNGDAGAGTVDPGGGDSNAPAQSQADAGTTSESSSGGSCSGAGACTTGAFIPCSTTCGSTGTGICSQSCEPPPAATCTPPAETCNYVDDDCDGSVDLNLFSPPASAAQKVWTSIGYQSSTIAQLQLLSRPSGYWMLLRSSGTAALELRDLDELGRPGTKRVVLTRTANQAPFKAASDGKWLAIATLANNVLEIQLYNAADGSAVSTTTYGGPKPSCGQLLPTAIAVQDEGGVARIAAARVAASWPVDGTGACPFPPGDASQVTGDHDVFFVSYSTSAWTAPTAAGTKLPAFASVFPLAAMTIAKSPCRPGWLVADNTKGPGIFREYESAGVERSRHDASIAGFPPLSLSGSTVIAENCSAGYADWALTSAASAALKDSTPDCSVRTMRIDIASGTTGAPRDLPLPSDIAWTGRVAGGAGHAFTVALDTQSRVRIYEFSATAPLREVKLPLVGTANAAQSSATNAAGGNYLLGGLGLLGLAATPKTVVVGIAPGQALTGLEASRSPGDTDPPIAVTYRIGCPD